MFFATNLGNEDGRLIRDAAIEPGVSERRLLRKLSTISDRLFWRTGCLTGCCGPCGRERRVMIGSFTGLDRRERRNPPFSQL